MNEPGWWTYLKTVAGTEDGQTIADAAGVSPPQVSRWKSGKNRPDADKLARFARTYQRPPVEALVAAGYLTANEAAEAIEIHRGPDALTDDELLTEIRQRMKGARHGVADQAQQNASDEARSAQEAVPGNRPGVVRHLRPTDDDDSAPDFSDPSLAARNVPDEPKD